ncbi:hypothetical protein GV729_25995 [Pseudomonas sp. Fl4BN2]|uniref:hypothetical protein n=1 Tax=Pseudomonas sp. Fl4BN1 TaxID=2697651 RepID=UPI001376B136|nr:hypothetical protein [Pseudomonas sp. Fl4BN1]NBF11946.1 hypothetical protein [Pseudomonas sp. Fl4BN1]NBF18710.1 hypothetical protein [Pseudomonas sp. Fl4BN2]
MDKFKARAGSIGKEVSPINRGDKHALFDDGELSQESLRLKTLAIAKKVFQKQG